MLRFVISVGPAQTLFLVGALTQYKKDTGRTDTTDVLLLAGHDLGNDGKRALSAMATAGWPWQEVLSFDPFLQPMNGQKHRRIRAEELDRTLHSFGVPDQIWFCMPHNIEEQVLMALFPHAELHLFEDGLGTYFDLYSIPRLLRHPRRVARYCSWAAIRHVRSAAPALRPAGQPLPRPPPDAGAPVPRAPRGYSLASEECPSLHRRDEVHAGGGGLAADGLEIGHRSHRGGPVRQTCADHGTIPVRTRSDLWKPECLLYEEVVRQYRASGYEVWWKEHPRARQPFGPRLQNLGCDVHAFSTNDALPIELFVREGMFDRSVAVSSTSLITLKRLYGVEPRTLIDRLPFPLPGSFHCARDMMSRHIAGIESDVESGRPALCVR